jgi:hypothetical protein
MEVIILVLVVVAALFAIVSGIWVAIALVTALFAHRAMLGTRCQADEESGD